MPGVIRRSRTLGTPSCLKGFGGRDYIKSGVLLASTVTESGVDEVQAVTITGSPNGGYITLTFGGDTTANIAYNASSATVEDELEALDSIGAGNVRVTGSAGGPYTVTFLGDLGEQNVTQMTAVSSLTGGTTPAVAVTTPTPGSAVDAGLLLFRKNTILTNVPGDTTKVQRFTGGGGEAIVGVCGRDIELFDRSAQSDVDVPIWCGPGCVFDASLVYDYAAHDTAFDAWCADNGNKVD